ANILHDMELLLSRLHDKRGLLFHRYIQFMFDLQVLHPFLDSNGKVGLLLGDLFLLKQGLHPPYISRYWWSSKQELDARVAYCAKSPEQNVSIFYPEVLRLYAECGLGLAVGIHD
ncbi:MAG: Fic family protein, partial [Desulfurivibrionaceae bacterium]